MQETEYPEMRVFAYQVIYIVEQASCYYHSKFHSDTVFLCKDIAPNKHNI